MTISYTSTPGLAELGGYAVSITDANGVPYPDGTGSYAAQTRTFPVDTSFEPYRREAFRHKSIPGQRQAIQMTNIMGEGTVNTEGLWRREQREWNQGAGQQYLDHKDDDQPGRFYSSKGVDVFNYPYQATLLPDTYRMDGTSTATSNIMAVACNGYMVVASSNGSSATVTYYTGIGTVGSVWTGSNAITGLTGVTTIYDIATANSYVYIATNNGIWFAQPGVSNFVNFVTGAYTMVAWANDQLIAGNGPYLYAFQPRSSSTAPVYGSAPSTTIASQAISGIGNGGSALVQLAGVNTGFVVGQSITISGTQTLATIASISLSSGVVTATCTSGYPHGLQVGNSIALSLGYSGSSVTENAVVTAVNTSTNTFSWRTKNVTTTVGFTGGTATATTSPYNGVWNISNISGNVITIQLAGGTNPSNTTYGAQTIGGQIGGNSAADLLWTHPDPSWTWSKAIGGETQVYFAGYSNHSNAKGNGCIYRSDLLGSSTTSSTNTQTITTAQVAQPWQLVTPVQALPMSPDEYPTALASYLNYIFIGTNRGIRMAQTLSIYDPTATATGDLKAGPLIPNILQPINSPVTAIVGDGRFVWFAWNNYDSQLVNASITNGSSTVTLNTYTSLPYVGQAISGLNIPTGTTITAVNGTTLTMSANATATNASRSLYLGSTGLGKLDLGTFIAGDPLAPVYASDLMVSGAGTINTLAWNPVKNVPTMAIGGLGVYEPNGVNVNGIITVTSTQGKYVTAGTLTTSIFDYGVPDQKAPVYFEYGGVTPSTSYIQANVVCEPLEPAVSLTLPVSSFTSPTAIGTAIKEYPMPTVNNISNPKSSQFQVIMTLHAGTSNTTTPIMYRWTLKSFPNVVSGTNISVVLQFFSVDTVDGAEVYMDPYDNFYWLESLRQSQNLVTYQEGPLSANIAIIESLDWIPHKRRGNYENGFEGDCVVTLKTLGPYSYTTPATA